MRDTCPFPMPNADTVCSIEGLLYFIWEREAINLARENGHLAPWTKDPILAKYKFTNIHRRDDRGSQWIIDNLIMAENYRERADLWFTLLIARLINWPPTLQALLNKNIIPCSPENFDADLFEHTLERIKNDGKKVYSGAYMLYPTKMEPGGNKSKAVAKYIIGSAIENAENIHMSLWNTEHQMSIERFVTELSKCFGISTFIAGQVAADLTYAPGHLDEAVDLLTYAPIGPGSSRGLNYLNGNAPFATWKQADFNFELTHILNQVVDRLEIVDMTLHDIQNCMCEFSKYCRTVLGEGKPKTIYQPETEF
jgi:hypothetical protein